jgi:hypothetical protein
VRFTAQLVAVPNHEAHSKEGRENAGDDGKQKEEQK